MFPSLRLVVFLAFVTLSAHSAEARIWKTKSGETKEADFIRYERGVVYFRSGPAGFFKLPLSSLCKEDQTYIGQLLELRDESVLKIEGSGQRIWVDRTGKRMKAKLFAVKKHGKILLRFPGKDHVVEFSSLSYEDQLFIRGQLGDKNQDIYLPVRDRRIRVWSDVDGNRIYARFVKFDSDEGQVTFEKQSKEFKAPLAKLKRQDQLFILDRKYESGIPK